ncbi:MAG: glycosyltransferase family 2 protein [Subtercola sp.]|nr:glycosyltransferase family 2 protein [Subtercola sp.]
MGLAEFDGLAIVVVNYGSSALLAEHLAPLTRRQPDLLTVVVDNFSSERERSLVVALADDEGWHTVLPTGNTGFGGGMNRGVLLAEQLGARTLLLVNPDAEIAEPAIGALLERSHEWPRTLFAPQILRPDGTVWFNGSDLYLEDGRTRSSRRRPTTFADVQPWLSGACLMLSDQLWRLIGGFDEEYFLYWEDIDFSQRVVAAGGAIAVASEAIAIHSQGGTQGAGATHYGDPKSDVYYYYNIRNRLLYAARHLDSEGIERWRRVTLPIAWEVLLRGGRRQFLRSLSPLYAAYRGVRDGRRLVKDELKMRRREAASG